MKTKQDLPAGFHFEPTKHKYYFDGKPMTGVTTILGVLNKPALVSWAARMAVEYIKTEVGITKDSSPINDYVVPFHVLEEAQTAYAKKRDDAAEKGTDVHSQVELWVLKCIQDCGGDPVAPSPSEAIQKFVNWAQLNQVKFLATEQKLFSKSLWIAGTADLVFEKEGKIYVGDVKTYAKIWDRTPFFQCAGYAMMWKEMELGSQVDGYCVLRISKDGTFEDLWSFDQEGDTEAFLSCAKIYRQLANFSR